jgi:excisionase family DNA binding protein
VKNISDNEDRLFSIKDTAKCLSVSTFTINRLIRAKQLKAVRIGKRVLISLSEIDRVIAEGCGNYR